MSDSSCNVRILQTIKHSGWNMFKDCYKREKVVLINLNRWLHCMQGGTISYNLSISFSLLVWLFTQKPIAITQPPISSQWTYLYRSYSLYGQTITERRAGKIVLYCEDAKVYTKLLPANIQCLCTYNYFFAVTFNFEYKICFKMEKKRYLLSTDTSLVVCKLAFIVCIFFVIYFSLKTIAIIILQVIMIQVNTLSGYWTGQGSILIVVSLHY